MQNYSKSFISSLVALSFFVVLAGCVPQKPGVVTDMPKTQESGATPAATSSAMAASPSVNASSFPMPPTNDFLREQGMMDEKTGQVDVGKTGDLKSKTDDLKTPEENVIVVKGNNFAYDKKEIRAKKGQPLTIVFENTEGMHDWVVDEFNAKTQVISAGKSEKVTFIPDKTGSFEYYCSVGQHRKMGMKGILIVE